MKKFIGAAALMLLCASAFSVSAADNSGSCGEGAQWKLENGVLTISGTGIAVPESEEALTTWQTDAAALVVSDGITGLGAFAFYGCENLADVSLADSVTYIAPQAFADCKSLTTVTLPSSVTSIGAEAFARCSALAEITIPESVTDIGANAFEDTAWLDSIDEEFVVVGDGVLYAYNADGEDITVPDEVKTIGDYTFADNTTVKKVKTANTEIIGDAAFMGCTALTDVTFGDSLVKIDDSAFKNCTALKEALIPDSVAELGEDAFMGCTALESVKFPKAVSISGNMFKDSSALSYFTAADTVASIGDSAFEGSGIKVIELPGGVKSIGFNAFKNCDSLTDVYFAGSEEAWNTVSIDEGNRSLTGALIFFDSDVKVKVNGSYITTDAYPFIENDRTLVPVRAISEALGADVSWDSETQTVSILLGENAVSLQIGSDTMYKNGTAVTLDVAATVRNDRTFIPLRAISEALDCTVDWDGTSALATIEG